MTTAKANDYQNLLDVLKHDLCQLPLTACTIDYYPNYVIGLIENWIEYYKVSIRPAMCAFSPDTVEGGTNLEDHLTRLKGGIKTTLELYYQGNVLDATTRFNDTLNNLYYKILKPVHIIAVDEEFFRGRIGDFDITKRDGLFHVPFQERHKVRTNRYSIPGLPALYLGDSTYVCWEEFQQHSFRNIYFSRFRNTEALNVIQISRIDDLIFDLQEKSPDDALAHIFRYLLLFPLSIACTISVQHAGSVFKAEYIIPQLLLQYVSKSEELDGIKYPSTLVNYSKISNVPCYNYVFPVKTLSEKGFCSHLTSKFELTQPTSLELEDLLYKTDKTMLTNFQTGRPTPKNDRPRLLKYFEGTPMGYDFTSFGQIEERLRKRPLTSL